MKYDEDDDCSWPKFLLLLVLERQRKRTDASIHLPSFSSYDARRRKECPTTKSGALHKLERGGLLSRSANEGPTFGATSQPPPRQQRRANTAESL